MATTLGVPLGLLTLLLAVVAFAATASPSKPSRHARLNAPPIGRHGLLQAQLASSPRSMAEAASLEAIPAPLVVQPARIRLWSATETAVADQQRRRRKVAAAPGAAMPSAPGPAPGPMVAMAPVAAVEVVEKEEIKEVMHYKHPGAGYKKKSPYYDKQQKLLGKTQVSMTMKCIIFLTAQFFIVYTALFIVQTVNRVRPTALKRLERCLECVAKTCYFIPMLCVLFLATRMRAIQLTQGMTDKYELPQWWVKQAMLACSLAVCLQTVLAAIYYALLSKDPDDAKGSMRRLAQDTARMWRTPDSAGGHENATRMGTETVTEKALNLARWFTIIALYLGFMAVCIGVCTMRAPEEVWGKAGGPPVSPAAFCTMFLATLYFAVHFCIELVKNVDEFLTPQGQRFGALDPVFLRDAATTVDIAPQLCILFLAARLRALQLDPKTGSPPQWAEIMFYVSSFAVLGLVLLCVVAAYLLPKEAETREEERAVEEQPVARLSARTKAAEFLRFILMFNLFMGAISVIFSTIVQKRADGPTPTVPPSIKCIMILTTVYFIVYSLMWLTATAKKLRYAPIRVTLLATFLETRAKEAIDFAPMLCVLFLGTFMRALQITGGQGAPQRWAQTSMYVGTMALVLMTVARLDMLILPSQPEAQKPDGAPPGAKPAANRIMAFFFMLHHLCLLLMHVAVAVVVLALVTMTPETAKGAGSLAEVI